MSISKASFDARKYDIPPFTGQTGRAYQEGFKKDMLAALGAKDCSGNEDDGWTMHNVVIDQDDQGGINGTAIPAANNVQNNLDRRNAITRARKSLFYIRKHVDDEATLEAIDNGPQTGAYAFACIEAAGLLPTSGLTDITYESEYNSLQVVDVGISAKTPKLIYNRIVSLNRQRPAADQKTETQLVLFFLSRMRELPQSFPTLLRDWCTKEIQNPTFLYPAGHAVAALRGMRRSATMLVDFGELWEMEFNSGRIRPAPAPTSSSRSKGHHVDGSSLSDHQAFSVDVDEVNLLALGAGSTLSVAGEVNCWVCRGFGHSKKGRDGKILCPSEIKSRPIADCIKGLQILEAKSGSSSSGARRFPFRRPNGGPSSGGNRFQKRFPPRGSSANALDNTDQQMDGFTMLAVDDETGDVYDYNTGDLCNLCDEPVQEGSMSVECETAAQAEPVLKKSILKQAATMKLAPTVEENMSVSVEQQSLKDSQEHGMEVDENQFFSSSNSIDVDEPAPRRRTIFSRVTTPCRVSLSRVFVALALLCQGTNGLTAGTTSGASTTFFPPLSYDVLNMTARFKPVGDMIDSGDPLIDSGASEHASGNKKIFPRKHISNYNPNTRVRVANGTALKVEFIGSMAIPVKKIENVSSAKKERYEYLLIGGGLYTPGLVHTLLSTRALYHRDGIRTYLNDELYLLLPNGDRVDLQETAKHYLLPMCDSEECVFIVEDTWEDVHSRLCHFSFERTRRSQEFVTGINLRGLKRPTDKCPVCVIAGTRNSSTPTSTRQRTFTFFGERIYSDTIWMPVKSSPFGFVYVVCFLDASTRYLAVYFLRNADGVECKAAFQQFMGDHKRWLTPKGICEWYSDNGTEFFSGIMDTFVRSIETRHMSILPGTPNANVAESVWRIILRPLRVCLAEGNAHQCNWPFALRQIVRVHNSLVTTSEAAIAQLPPYTNLTGQVPDLSVLHPIFCDIIYPGTATHTSV